MGKRRLKNKHWIKGILFVFLLLTACSHTQTSKPALEEKLLLPVPTVQDTQKVQGVQAGQDEDLSSLLEDLGGKKESGEAPVPGQASPAAIAPIEYNGELQDQAQKPISAAEEESPFSKTKMVRATLDKMALPDFIHSIFSELLTLNYVMDPSVESSRETVTLNLNQKISEYDLYQMVLDILERYGVSVYAKNNIYYLQKAARSKKIAIGIGALVSDIPDAPGEIQQLIPLKYADAENVKQLIPDIKEAKITVDQRENILIVTGSKGQIKEVMSVVATLDKPAMRGRYVGIENLSYWDPADMVKQLTDILRQEGIPVSERPGMRGVYIKTLERKSALVVFAAEKEWLERVSHWIKILDAPLDKEEGQYFLYFPQRSKASELGSALQKILGMSSPGSGESQSGKKTDTDKTSEPLVTSTNTDMNVRIVVDQTRNVLIIHGTPKEYKVLQSLLNKLDIMPVQILIEATVAEVTLKDDLKQGLEWYFEQISGDQIKKIGTLGGLGIGSGGLDFSLVDKSTDTFKVVVNALAQKGLVNILSSPRLTVRDGKSATFTVGTEVPVVTSEATSSEITLEGGTSGILRSVQYRSTGVSLSVTPSAHSQGIVTLVINQEVSEAQPNQTSSIDSPMILNRSLSTEVVAADGQTVLLGGLIKESSGDTITKVPFVGDIPIIGRLFRTQSEAVNKTELVVMITPHIIRNSQQMDDILDDLFESFESIQKETVSPASPPKGAE